mgnify:FL=1
MKKSFFFVAIAALAFLSCERHELEEMTPESYTFKASIEDFATKADINKANALVWAQGDQIGIYVNDDSWNDKNQPFTLVGEGGSTSGNFRWNYENGNFTDEYAAAAFFPWQGTGSDVNNVYGNVMYFKLPESYYGYTSGQMLTPLIASLENSSSPIKFKHAGAAVKVTINNLPAGAHSIGMCVDGQQVYGGYHVTYANAGTDALAPDGTTPDTEKNTVWLNYTNDTETAFTFVFPVPTLTQPKLSFKIYDRNDVLVWSKNLKAQSSNLGRADVLVMPAIDIDYYKQLTISTEWTFCGTIGDSGWTDDIPMYTDGTVCILSGKTFQNGNKFKIRKNKAWDEAYPSSDWEFNEGNAGTKDIIFNIDTKTINVVDAGCPYPTAQ